MLQPRQGGGYPPLRPARQRPVAGARGGGAGDVCQGRGGALPVGTTAQVVRLRAAWPRAGHRRHGAGGRRVDRGLWRTQLRRHLRGDARRGDDPFRPRAGGDAAAAGDRFGADCLPGGRLHLRRLHVGRRVRARAAEGKRDEQPRPCRAGRRRGRRRGAARAARGDDAGDGERPPPQRRLPRRRGEWAGRGERRAGRRRHSEWVERAAVPRRGRVKALRV
mmetsp:Transcript_4696/g.14319  ORF Transcript_4696/g.14319 Transcript_4696/m.14319 type:complete len:220 (-) Transcript_4696:990-1649(-)